MLASANEFSFRSFKGKPTILQVIPEVKSGGVEIEALEIAKAIVSANGRALIAANIKENIQLPKEIKFINLPLNTKNPFQIARNANLLKEVIQREKVDIVHVRSRAPAWSAYKAARSLKIPFITTYHAAYPSNSVIKSFYNSVMARGDRVIAISHFIKDHLIKTYQMYSWFDPSKIRLILRGIDLHYFDPSTISQERMAHLRKEWQIPPHMRLVLLPGRVSRLKGHKVLIHALSLMKHSDVMVYFVGSAEGHESYLNSLLQEASSLDLEGRVKWAPPSHDLSAAYNIADIIVCPSLLPEGFGRLIAEAQAMKKLIISSDHGAASEIIEQGVTGILVPPNDPRALANALDEALQLSPECLAEMGNLSHERVKSFFSKESMSSQTIQVYNEFLNKDEKF